MLSETDIVTGYLWFLGRVPSSEEIDANRRHYQHVDFGALQDFQRSLTTSREFQVRRIQLHRLSRGAPTELQCERLVFLHVEKCGGTTLHAMLATLFDPIRICPERHDGLGDLTINELAQFDFLSGHFDLSCCRSIPGRLRLVTMLREPKARLLSLYQFWRAHKPDPHRDAYNLLTMARTMPPEAFFADPVVKNHRNVRNAITGQLIRTGSAMMLSPDDPIRFDPPAALELALSKLDEFTVVGILEQFDESRLLLNATLGVELQPLAPQQVLAELIKSNQEMVEVPPVEMTGELDQLLDPLIDIDARLYRRTRVRFAASLHEMGITTRAVESEC